MKFSYIAYAVGHGVVKGNLDARTPGEANAEVLRMGYKPINLAPVARTATLESLFPSLFKAGQGQLLGFCHNLTTLLNGGSTLPRALATLQKESHHKAMRNILESLLKKLEEGGKLSQALAEHPEVFNPLFVSVVEAGEQSGRLGAALEQMAEILEKQREAKQKIIRTLMYPAAIMGLSLVSLSVLMVVAVPPMLNVLQKMGTDVPLLTRVLVAIFTHVKDDFLQIFLGISALATLPSWLRFIPRARHWIDTLKVRSPMIGPMVVTGELSRLSSTLAMLLEAGVPISTALQLGIGGCKNSILREAFLDAQESLMSGHGLAGALRRHPIIPGMFVELVAVGEESNQLQRTMRDSAASYQKQQDRRIDGLMATLEPLSTLAVGAMVGLMAFSMFLPIYRGLGSIK